MAARLLAAVVLLAAASAHGAQARASRAARAAQALDPPTTVCAVPAVVQKGIQVRWQRLLGAADER